MIGRPTRYTRTDTLCPYTTLLRAWRRNGHRHRQRGATAQLRRRLLRACGPGEQTLRQLSPDAWERRKPRALLPPLRNRKAHDLGIALHCWRYNAVYRRITTDSI